MKTLWFKREFVEQIICGAKTNTIRVQSSRLPKAGDEVNFSVGPRKPFAQALIESVTPIQKNNENIDAVALRRCLGDVERPLCMISFVLINP